MSAAPPDTAKSKLSASAKRPAEDFDDTVVAERNASAKRNSANVRAEDAVVEETPADIREDKEGESGNEEDSSEAESQAGEASHHEGEESAPPLPEEDLPPLPQEPLPVEDDGWQPVWDQTNQAFYFYNRFTQATQWDNPRVPEATSAVPLAPGVAPAAGSPAAAQAARPAGGYDPSIHGDYDPNAWYAQPAQTESTDAATVPTNAADLYAQTGAFNRFTGRWQAAELGPEMHNDENKSRRQMNAFFDVDAAANSHDGRSLKAERSGKKLSKAELKQFKEKRKAKKEEKRRAWLRD